LLNFIEYQQRRCTVAASTINRRLAVLQRFFIFLCGRAPAFSAWQSPGQVLFRRGRRVALVQVRTPQRLITPLNDQEACTFFHTLRTARDRAITLLMWADGLRTCEILTLSLGDVDFQNMSIKLLGKGRKERMMPLAENVAKVLLQYLAQERPARSSSRFFVVLKGPRRGQPMTYSGLHRIFRYHRLTSQVHNANPHRFRHTFGANMTRAHVPLAVLAKMMGHSSPRTTVRYIQLNDPEVRQQYQEALKTLSTTDWHNASSTKNS
jgi:site-specific recombinase XerD